MPLIAPAKVNLCLYLGPRRADGLHELCSLFCPVTLADLVEVSGGGDHDEVVCPGLDGENLAARALKALRSAGWDREPLRIEIEKRVPVAAGLGGGSADAAAVLRLAQGDVNDMDQIALQLGADVPSQLVPSMALVEGAGERVERLPEPRQHGFVLLPGGGGLSTAEVFEQADRMGLGRPAEELEQLRARLAAAAGSGASPLDYADLLHNDLEPAAVALRPDIGGALDELRGAGAGVALVTGSGPTAFGLFGDLDSAASAAEQIGRDDAIVCASGLP